MEPFLHYVHGRNLGVPNISRSREESSSSRGSRSSRRVLLSGLLLGALLIASPVFAQEQTPDWQTQVRKYCEAQDWESALRIVDQEVARAPQDMDVGPGARAFWFGRGRSRKEKGNTWKS
jgi:hypothetical protein